MDHSLIDIICFNGHALNKVPRYFRRQQGTRIGRRHAANRGQRPHPPLIGCSMVTKTCESAAVRKLLQMVVDQNMGSCDRAKASSPR
jgi:hypothetical protein